MPDLRRSAVARNQKHVEGILVGNGANPIFREEAPVSRERPASYDNQGDIDLPFDAREARSGSQWPQGAVEEACSGPRTHRRHIASLSQPKVRSSR